MAIVRLTHLVEVAGFEAAEVPQENLIDRAVFAKLNHMRVAPSEECTDSEFLRRAVPGHNWPDAEPGGSDGVSG